MTDRAAGELLAAAKVTGDAGELALELRERHDPHAARVSRLALATWKLLRTR